MLRLCIFAVIIHILFLYSVFDLYFTSPLVPVSRHYSISTSPVAKRLFLFVCDGLRADKFFVNRIQHAPYLRGLVENGAVFGVSNTKVPTESRPGHVAMIAGFYEDVAAITKGWKENPVEFDSLFNQSRHTWAWGSPDILPMFERGAVSGRVSTHMYDSSFEDFAKNASIQDTWVFEHVEKFFEQPPRDLLAQDRLVFFLHLLGTDTIGHADKPHSKKYTDNIVLVDHGVEQIVKLVEKYFNDKSTSFIFSSDHGMRDWGSHGAGHPDETMTPFVGWGAGFATKTERLKEDLDFSDLLKLPQMLQADIAALMSCIIGANFPANSVGKVPVEFLGAHDKYKAECLVANARQLAETALNLHNAYKRGSLLSFSPYPDFDIDLIEQNLARMEEAVSKGQLKTVQQQASVFIDHMLAASRYYHTYNNAYIGFAVSSGFLLWIAYVISHLLVDSEFNRQKIETKNIYSCKNLTYLAVSALVFMILLLKRSQLSHFAYWLLPVYLGCDFLFGLQERTGSIFGHFASSGRNLVCFLSVLCGLEAIVWAYWFRRALVIAIVGASSFTAIFSSSGGRSFLLFPLAIVCLSVFPLLPPADSGQQAFELVYAVAGLVIVAVFFAPSKFTALKPHCHEKCARARNVQLVTLAVVLVVKIVTVQSIANSSHVPVICHVISWLLLFTFYLPVFYTCPSKQGRIFAIFLSIFTLYSLLSVYYESLYLVVLEIVLLIWYSRSYNIDDNEKILQNNFGSILADSFLLVILINVSLLAPANIAVINSFDLVSVYSFLTLFSPFIIMTLLIIKVLLPLFCVVIAFVEICHIRNYSLTTSLLLVMALSDFTALHFFFSVRTEGSWLEIGTSLSHYCIQMFAAVALIPFVAIARFLLYGQPFHRKSLLYKTA